MGNEVHIFDATFAQTTLADWLDLVDRQDDGDCFIDFLGPKHACLTADHHDFMSVNADQSKTLLVTFETVSDFWQGGRQGTPLAWQIAKTTGWACMTCVSGGETWFRDHYVYSFIDRLVDEGRLDAYENVLFYGKGSCGYAAAAFSLAAPSATVLTIAPQATLLPNIAGWDHRFNQARKLGFSAPYGFAPEMAEAARATYVLFDPAMDLDHMHAQLFATHGATVLRTPYLSNITQELLVESDQLVPLMTSALEGSLTQSRLSFMLRTRKTYLPYLRQLLHITDTRDRAGLSTRVCEFTLERYQAPRFRKRLEQLKAKMSPEKDISVA